MKNKREKLITSGKTSAGHLGKIKILKNKGDETRDDDAAFGRLMALNRGPPSVKRALVIHIRSYVHTCLHTETAMEENIFLIFLFYFEVLKKEISYRKRQKWKKETCEFRLSFVCCWE